MATTPSQKPVASELPQDLKFNSGKIDEYVTSMGWTYTDRFGVKHYTIQGNNYLSQQAMAAYGYVILTGLTFTTGATINEPNEVLLNTADGEYYKWTGSFALGSKEVPENSSPASTGGISPGAWIGVGDASVRAFIASPEGSKNVGNGQSTIHDTLYHTIEEFSLSDSDAGIDGCLSATASDGRTTWIKGSKTLTKSVDAPDGISIINDGEITATADPRAPAFNLGSKTKMTGGSIVNTGISQAIRSANTENVTVRDVAAKNTAITPSSTFAYAFDINGVKDMKLSGLKAEGYTGGLALTNTTRVIASDLYFSKMVFHPTLVAGSYGVLLGGGCRNTVIDNLLFEAAADGTGRHAVYQSFSDGKGQTNTIVNSMIADYSLTPAGVSPQNGINIRSNLRAIYANNIIDGSRIGGITSNGDISDQLITGNVIQEYKSGTASAYGITPGDNSGDFKFRNSIVSNNVVNISLTTGSATDVIYGIVVSGTGNAYIGNITNLPFGGYPYVVRAGTTYCSILAGSDLGINGVPMFLFDGTASNITIKGCSKFGRLWFRKGGLDNVTDLTVDWARRAMVAVTAGVVSYEDTNELISSTSVNSSGIVITFKSHVTIASLDTATATTRKTTVPMIPVITVRSGKTLTIEFHNSSGAFINPTSTTCAVTITLFS